MLARIRKSMEDKDQGFTLIELLVVMIIIGILAAIAIPVFLSQRAKARDTSTKADVSTVGKEIATYYVDGSLALTATDNGGSLNLKDTGTYTTAPNDLKLSQGTTLNGAIKYSVATSPDSTWCVAMTNTNGSIKSFQYSAKNGLAAGSCVAGTY